MNIKGGGLRVLHVILNLGEANGQYNEHCLPMAETYDISICTFFPPQLSPPPTIRLFPGNGRLRGFFRAFFAAIDSKHHDVVHVHAPQSGALVVLGLLARLRYRRLRSRMVYTVQDSFYDYRPRNKALMLIALAGFSRIIFCSRAAYDSLPALARWVVRGRWTVVQNAMDVARIDRALEGRGVAPDEELFTVICVGRLEPVKDPFTLLSAFAQVADERSSLVLVGAGSLEGAVCEHAEDLGITDVVLLTGLIPRDEVFEQCGRADVLVSASHGEGLPVAVMEAMAVGCPVILSDIPPHRELVHGADFVPLVPVSDVEGFAEAMRRIRELPSEARRELGRRARQHVVPRFDVSTMHAKVNAVYRGAAAPEECPALVSDGRPAAGDA